MKKVAIAFALFLLLLAGFVNSKAQVVIKVRPAEPTVVETRPAAPFKEAVWIGPEWRWRHGKYERVPGHWIHPHPGWRWEAGRWEERPGGYIWIGGRWRK